MGRLRLNYQSTDGVLAQDHRGRRGGADTGATFNPATLWYQDALLLLENLFDGAPDGVLRPEYRLRLPGIEGKAVVTRMIGGDADGAGLEALGDPLDKRCNQAGHRAGFAERPAQGKEIREVLRGSRAALRNQSNPIPIHVKGFANDQRASCGGRVGWQGGVHTHFADARDEKDGAADGDFVTGPEHGLRHGVPIDEGGVAAPQILENNRLAVQRNFTVASRHEGIAYFDITQDISSEHEGAGCDNP